MSMYPSPQVLHRRSPYDQHRCDSSRDSLDYFDTTAEEKSILGMDVGSDASQEDKVNVFIVFVFILELLLLIFVVVLEYFLRFTEVFPVRTLNFTCTDVTLSYSSQENSYQYFAYNANVPYTVIIALCFCLPPVIILISEIAVWAFSEQPQKTIHVLCRPCSVPQPIRRIIRFVGAFLFGLLVAMIFCDVTKLMVGRLRPTFLETCRLNETHCTEARGALVGEDACTATDKQALRQARLSFPSLHATMTTFAAGYLAIYIHCAVRSHTVRIVRPFLTLSFLLLALLCGLTRYGLRYSHWTDVAAGAALGALVALYLGVYVLNGFRESLSSRRLYHRMRNFMAEQKAQEMRDFYKEDRLSRQTHTAFTNPAYPSSMHDREGPPGYHANHVWAGGLLIPRPQTRATASPSPLTIAGNHGNESADTDERLSRDGRGSRAGHDTFQRDLTRTLDHYRLDRDRKSVV